MPYLDWTELVESTIPEKKNLSIIEFGLGDGTEYLLDNFKFVYSHELINDSKWYHKTVEKLSHRKNWEHKLVMFKDIDFVDFNPILPQALIDDISLLFAKYNFDIAFIDGDYHVRGDIASFILNTFAPKYVIIHDTNYAWEVDGYARMIIPNNYSSVSSSTGEGTMIFIRELSI